MNAHRLSRHPWHLAATVLLGLMFTGSAMAQWQWIDSTGRRVFSDTPPPAGTPDKNVLKRPGAGAPVPQAAPAAGEPKAAPAAAASPKASAQDKELEARKKQAEDAEKAKQKAEQEKFAKAREENCERAKRSKTTLESGVRLATTNAKGEREIMDDAARKAEAKRLDEIVQRDCGPLPQPKAGPQ